VKSALNSERPGRNAALARCMLPMVLSAVVTTAAARAGAGQVSNSQPVCAPALVQPGAAFSAVYVLAEQPDVSASSLESQLEPFNVVSWSVSRLQEDADGRFCLTVRLFCLETGEMTIPGPVLTTASGTRVQMPEARVRVAAPELTPALSNLRSLRPCRRVSYETGLPAAVVAIPAAVALALLLYKTTRKTSSHVRALPSDADGGIAELRGMTGTDPRLAAETIWRALRDHMIVQHDWPPGITPRAALGRVRREADAADAASAQIERLLRFCEDALFAPTPPPLPADALQATIELVSASEHERRHAQES